MNQPKASKFCVRERQASEIAKRESSASSMPTHKLPRRQQMPGSLGKSCPKSTKIARDQNEGSLAEIRREGLTVRQLRMAWRLAQEQGLNPSSTFDAVRQLRSGRIHSFDDTNKQAPFKNSLARAKTQKDSSDTSSIAQELRMALEQRSNLPQIVESKKNLPAAPSKSSTPTQQEAGNVQFHFAVRRRRKLILLGSRLGLFVLLPTILAFTYFAYLATPSYTTKSQFIVQQAEAATSQQSLSGSALTAISQDSILVQGYLTSREALRRLDSDHGYRAHFSQLSVDSLQRIPEGASNETVYKHFRSHVKVGYDPTEGVIRMEVAALSPEMSQTFSKALIGFAEERVEQLTKRKRADQMNGARKTYEDAETKMVNAQAKVLKLQEKLGVLDPVSETTGIMTQVNTFETQLAEKRLQLRQLLNNLSPNEARVAGVTGEIEHLQTLVVELRSKLTENTGDGSLASITARLRMAEVDLETRTIIMRESQDQLEMARVEANRQVRFISVGVAPIPTDEPTYPKAFEDTLIAFLIFGASYLFASVTIGILREQLI